MSGAVLYIKPAGTLGRVGEGVASLPDPAQGPQWSFFKPTSMQSADAISSRSWTSGPIRYTSVPRIDC
jgi:hypothetical protein